MSDERTPDPVPGPVAEQFVTTMNDGYRDSLHLIGRVLGERPTARDTRAVGVDPEGLDVVVTDDAGSHAVRVPFLRPVRHSVELTERAFGLVARARELSGEEEETSAEREMARRRVIRTRLTTVAAVADVHPRLRRITFAGGDLVDFAPIGPDSYLYVLLPPPGHDALTIDRSFTWTQHKEMPEELRPVGAYYTVRSWRPERCELDMLFVLHEPSGPASEWAARAEPGDPVALWGPRTAYDPPEDTRWHLLVADETGLPAAAAILESLPAGQPAVVVAEVGSAADREVLPSRPDTDVRWIHRDGRAAGSDPHAVVDVVRGLDLPEGPGYVWGGGESRTMTQVRHHVRDELGMPQERVSLLAYWRRAGTDD